MEYGICDLSIIPIRAEPSDKSEITSQLLFGESYKVAINRDKWVKIKTSYDDYEGWIDQKQYNTVSKADFDILQSKEISVALDLVGTAVSNKRHTPIVIGSSLPDFDGLNFKIIKEKFIYNGQAVTPGSHTGYDSIVEKCAMKFLNAPYLWGGRSPFGIDCSGFTQIVFKLLGIQLPRDSYQQAECGKPVDFVAQATIGDLAFFQNDEGKITHVGIVIGEGKIIHASGRVRIDKLDHFGIFQEKTRKYSHHLKSIRRIW